MSRYSNIQSINTPENLKRRYVTVKYPEILLDFSDIYVYTTRGDRYDTLALSYYNNPSIWWIITRANPTLTNADSLIPPLGVQIRIPGPSRVASILSKFDTMNQYNF